MSKPKFTDYVDLIHTLFDKFAQAQTPKPKRVKSTLVYNPYSKT